MGSIPKYNFKAEDIVKCGRTSQCNINGIKNILSKNEELPKISDEQIVLFLLACDNNVEQAYTTIKCYFQQRINAPEFFFSRDPLSEEFIKHFNVTFGAIMPVRTEENYAVIYQGLRDCTYYKLDVDFQIKIFFMTIEALLNTNPPDGLICIIDTKGLGIMHLTRIKLSIIKKFFPYIQESLNVKLIRIHLINCTYIVDKVLSICKPFMKKELMELLVIHNTSMKLEEFHEKHIPSQYLPKDLGGSLPSIENLNEILLENLQNMKPFFDADENQCKSYKKE